MIINHVFTLCQLQQIVDYPDTVKALGNTNEKRIMFYVNNFDYLTCNDIRYMALSHLTTQLKNRS